MPEHNVVGVSHPPRPISLQETVLLILYLGGEILAGIIAKIMNQMNGVTEQDPALVGTLLHGDLCPTMPILKDSLP